MRRAGYLAAVAGGKSAGGVPLRPPRRLFAPEPMFVETPTVPTQAVRFAPPATEARVEPTSRTAPAPTPRVAPEVEPTRIEPAATEPAGPEPLTPARAVPPAPLEPARPVARAQREQVALPAKLEPTQQIRGAHEERAPAPTLDPPPTAAALRAPRAEPAAVVHVKPREPEASVVLTPPPPAAERPSVTLDPPRVDPRRALDVLVDASPAPRTAPRAERVPVPQVHIGTIEVTVVPPPPPPAPPAAAAAAPVRVRSTIDSRPAVPGRWFGLAQR
jgi:hypothetical protein